MLSKIHPVIQTTAIVILCPLAASCWIAGLSGSFDVSIFWPVLVALWGTLLSLAPEYGAKGSTARFRSAVVFVVSSILLLANIYYAPSNTELTLGLGALAFAALLAMAFCIFRNGFGNVRQEFRLLLGYVGTLAGLFGGIAIGMVFG